MRKLFPLLTALLIVGELAHAQTGGVARFFWKGTNVFVNNYQGAADNVLYWGWGDLAATSIRWWNMGSYGSLRSCENDNSGGRTRSLLRFDLSLLRETGMVCTNAVLYLTENPIGTNYTSGLYWGSYPFSIYRVADANHGWLEGTNQLKHGTVGESCWGARVITNTASGTNWAGSAGLSTPTTDYHATALASGITYYHTPTNGYNTIAIPLPASMVNGWITGTNAGLILRTDTALSTNVCVFFSKEGSTAAYRPALQLWYYFKPRGTVILVF